MKNFIVLSIVFIFLLAGCGKAEQKTSLVDYDNSKLKAELKHGSYQPKLPTKMPFKVDNTTVKFLDDRSISIYFDSPGKGERGSHIFLSMTKGEGNYANLTNSVDVNIGKIKGTYGEKIARQRTINWKEDDIAYSLTFQWYKSDSIITKEQLIKTAESFE